MKRIIGQTSALELLLRFMPFKHIIFTIALCSGYTGTPFADGFTEAQQYLGLGLHLGSVACVNITVTAANLWSPCPAHFT